MSSRHTLRLHAVQEIRAEMARQRKTGLDLAALLHCSQSTASRRLNGETVLDLDELAQIAEWLHVPVENFLSPPTVAGHRTAAA